MPVSGATHDSGAAAAHKFAKPVVVSWNISGSDDMLQVRCPAACRMQRSNAWTRSGSWDPMYDQSGTSVRRHLRWTSCSARPVQIYHDSVSGPH